MGSSPVKRPGILVKRKMLETKELHMLEVENLSFSYEDRKALEDLSLAVNPGEILAVIGPNGAGKSTLIRVLSGALPHYQGSVRVDGNDTRGMTTAQRARRLAVVPQARNMPPAFTVYQSVLMGRTPYLGWLGQVGSKDRQLARLALERTCCLDLADRMVGEISGGEQQRVLLARALAQDTPVLLLDEPTTHLDLQHQSGLLNLVRDLANKQQLAVLMALHDLNLASIYADRVALLVEGRLMAIGIPHEVLTEQTLTEVYHVPVHIVPHPDYGSPLVLPDGRLGADS
jgi:cobalamin transport system ATP-binding protein